MQATTDQVTDQKTRIGNTDTTETLRICREAAFLASDGQEISYRYRRPSVTSDQVILLFHRGHENSGR